MIKSVLRRCFSVFGLPFKLVRNSRFYRPKSLPYVSGDTFRFFAKYRFGDKHDRVFDPEKVLEGDVIFCKGEHARDFLITVSPKIRHSFVLVSGNSDQNIGREFKTLLPSNLSSRWAQNLTENFDERVKPIPIGLENLHYRKNGLVRDFNLLTKKIPEKNNRILCSFNLKTNVSERSTATRVAHNLNVVDFYSTGNLYDYRRELQKYSFVLSPPGNGFDCHRTWEAIYLGVIPIVKKGFATEFFLKLDYLLLWLMTGMNFLSSVLLSG